ncbi:patched domain-containing protein 3-like [Branchiostoma lanceolatum]|uniref:patched domain-containing protein 3-like n=1 Tax=Branchiostoma lanceolatum TaxID=7740 RepID=UPI0034554580
MMEHGVTERWMRRAFQKFGRFLARHPHAFLLASLVLAGSLGGGLYFLGNEGSIEKLYTPEDGPGKVEREYVRTNFPVNDSEHFLPSRVITAGRYGAVIIRPRGEVSDNALHTAVLDAAVSLHNNISDLVTDELGLSYTDVCAKWKTDCVISGLDLLDFIATSFPNVTVGYPWTSLPGGLRTFSGAILGDVTLKDETETVKKVGAIKLIYHLRSSREDDDRRSEAWEGAFLENMAVFSSDVIAVTWSTSHSLETEIAEMATRAVPNLAAYTVSMLLAFAVLSCVMRDPVRSKPFLGMVGVLGAGMAVMATVGLFSYCGVMFNNLVAAMPFLIIGVGVDNMFLLLAAWRRTSPRRSVEERASRVGVGVDNMFLLLAAWRRTSPRRSVEERASRVGVGVDNMFLLLAAWRRTSPRRSVEERASRVGVGVDNMFLLLAAWRRTSPRRSVEERASRVGVGVDNMFLLLAAWRRTSPRHSVGVDNMFLLLAAWRRTSPRHSVGVDNMFLLLAAWRRTSPRRSVGVDNMFLLLAAWRRTSPRRSVEERAAETFAEAGVSITITAMTNALAFAVGAITSFPGVRIFCMYSGVAVLFAYLFQINFFGACLIYDGIREHQHRHFLTCLRVPPPTKADQPACCPRSCRTGDASVDLRVPTPTKADQPGCGSRSCCTGDASAGLRVPTPTKADHPTCCPRSCCTGDASAGLRVHTPIKADQPGCHPRSCCTGDASDQDGEDHNDHLLMLFFKNYYGPFMTQKWVKVAVTAMFFGYIGVGVWGCTRLREGVPLSKLAEDGSYVARFLDQDDRYFSEYDVRVGVMVTERVDYWDPDVQDQLEAMLADFEDTDFTYGKNESESWLRVYHKFAEQIPGLNLTDKTSFMTGLKDIFLKTPGLVRYSYDLQFSEDGGEILASRFFVQTKQIDDTIREKHMMLKMRGVAKNAPVRTTVYHPAFVYYDQYTAILPNTLQNLGIATVAMLVVSLILMPHPVHAVWVTLAIASICLGVVGFMTLWGINLDSISMISLIMCIGFSVDFSAHFIYSFVSAEESARDAKAVHALYSLGVPILQGSISTVLGVAALSTAPSYGFRTFFKTVFLVVVFGLLHGIVFLPVMLSCLGTKLKMCGVLYCTSGDKIHRVAPAKSTTDLPEICREREAPSFTLSLTPVEGTTNPAYEHEIPRERGASPFPIILMPD